MNILLLTSVISGILVQDICQKSYGRRTGGGYFIFPAVSSLVAALMFLLLGFRDFYFEKGMLLYSALFAIGYGGAAVFGLYALASGPYALTSLFGKYSLIIPTFWGILFLNEPTGTSLYIGLLFLFLSISMISLKEKKKDEKKVKITAKWVFYVFAYFVGNGMCSTVQKLQQVTFSGAGKNEFMFAALMMVFAFFLIMSFKTEKMQMIPCIKTGIWMMIARGLANGLVNLFVMILSNSMPASVMFPIIAGVGLMASTVVSVVLYKERLNIYRYIGLALGVVSVVLLNL